MPTGTVKWFNSAKGYGFIAPDEGGKDIFVHVSQVERSGMTGLAENQKVANCVANAVAKNVSAGVRATCAAVFLIGDPTAAAASYESRYNK